MGEDKAYDTADHVAHLRAINVTPHVTQNDSITATGKRRQSAIDGRTTRHEGYGMSQSCRAMIECIFGWGKRHGTMRKTKHRGLASVATDFMLNLIAYNLIRIPKLLAAQVSVCSQHPDRPKPQGKKTGNATLSRFFSRLLDQMIYFRSIELPSWRQAAISNVAGTSSVSSHIFQDDRVESDPGKIDSRARRYGSSPRRPSSTVPDLACLIFAR